MGLKRVGMILGVVGATLVVNAPSDVNACGGCFVGPQTLQVVTDHRMVLSISSQQTTLWDQFQYSGAAAEFSWILPIRYTERTRVHLADDGFMRMADSLTAPVISPPPNAFDCIRLRGAPSAGSVSDSAPATDAGVTVLRQEVVGPYAVSIIRGNDPMAIRDWLSMNGYTVPAPVVPIIDHYTAMRMDYIALRLRPGEGINRMSPVRVTLDGAQPVLPLRMIAAGVVDRVGLSLVVIASSRYEAQNFPNGEIRNSDLTWDFTRPGNPEDDFLAAFNAQNGANGNRLWLTESATRQTRDDWTARAPSFRNPTTPVGPGGRPPFDAGSPPPPDAGDTGDTGEAMMTTDPTDDVRVAFEGIGASAVVTRMRADMLATMLTQDLQLRASDLGLRAREYTYGRLINDPGPMCMNFGMGPIPGSPTSEVAPPVMSEGGIRCATTPGPVRTRERTLALLAGLAAATLVRRARRRV